MLHNKYIITIFVSFLTSHIVMYALYLVRTSICTGISVIYITSLIFMPLLAITKLAPV